MQITVNDYTAARRCLVGTARLIAHAVQRSIASSVRDLCKFEHSCLVNPLLSGSASTISNVVHLKLCRAVE